MSYEHASLIIAVPLFSISLWFMGKGLSKVAKASKTENSALQNKLMSQAFQSIYYSLAIVFFTVAAAVVAEFIRAKVKTPSG